MGKDCNQPWQTTMKTVMCDENVLTGVSRLLEMQNGDQDGLDTLNILQNGDDVDSIKSQTKERHLIIEEKLSPSVFEPKCNPSQTHAAPVNSGRSSPVNVDVDHYRSSSQHSNCNGCEPSVMGGEQIHGGNNVNSGDLSVNSKDDQPRVHCRSDYIKKVGVDKENTNISDDIGLSLNDLHVSETQDVPVNLTNSDNSRLSRVLENIPFVYIPMTKQLGLMSDSHDVNRQTECDNIHNPVTPSACKHSVSVDESKTYRNCDSVSINGEDNSEEHVDAESQPGPSNPNALKTDKVDSTSFSSVSSISTSTEVSISTPSVPDDSSDCRNQLGDEEDSDFMEINLHSRNSFEPTRSALAENSKDDKGARPKKKSLSGFLSRNLFARKPKDVNQSYESAPGWKLFGRIPPKETEKKDVSQVLEDYQAKHRSNSSESQSRKKQDIEVLSTTALILENRPMNLPSKCPEEEQRHKLEYEAMVEAAKKKELKELRLKKKQLQQQLKREDHRAACAKYWNNDVLPNWENMHNQKKTRELWWAGLPPNVRGKVWKLAIGNDLNITSELYEICLSRAKDKMNLFDIEPGDPSGPSETSSEPPSNKEASVELIKLDVARTFPQLCIFQKGGPYYELLHSLLGAYACYRPDVGYVQGMSFIAAVLLLNMDVADAFICFANLLNKPCQVAFFRMDESLMKCYFQTFEEFFKENMPKLYQHFVHLSVTPEVYIIDWMFTLFSKSLPLDVACRVWDVFCRDGEEFLFRTALGILKMHEETLLHMDFIHLAQFMTKLPEVISGERLFRSIDWVKMSIEKKRFTQVLSSFREAKES